MKTIQLTLFFSLLVFTLADTSSPRYLFNLFDDNRDNVLQESEIFNMFIRSEADEITPKVMSQLKRDSKKYLRDFSSTNTLTYAQWEKMLSFRHIKTPGSPQQLHLSLTGIDGEMIIMWATKSN